MGYRAPRLIALAFGNSNYAVIADATPFYIGYCNRSPDTGEGNSQSVFPKSGVVRAVYMKGIFTTVGTNEDWTMNLRINATTSYLIQTVGSTSAYRLWKNDDMNVRVAAGDVFEIVSEAVTWATNPANVRFQGYLLLECE